MKSLYKAKKKLKSFKFETMGLFKAVLIFGTGVYTGIYASQNYEIEKLDSPKAIFKSIQDYLKQYEKKKDVVEEKHKSN